MGIEVCGTGKKIDEWEVMEKTPLQGMDEKYDIVELLLLLERTSRKDIRTRVQAGICETHLHAPAREGDFDVVELLQIKFVSKESERLSESHCIDRYGAKWQSQCGSDNNQ